MLAVIQSFDFNLCSSSFIHFNDLKLVLQMLKVVHIEMYTRVFFKNEFCLLSSPVFNRLLTLNRDRVI